MLDVRRACTRALISGVAIAALALAGFAGTLRAATSEIVVGPLGIVSGTATGSITGLAPNSQVTVDGQTLAADSSGTVTLVSSPLDGTAGLTVGFTDTDGTPQSVTVDLTDSLTGLPLNTAAILDPIANTTRETRVTVGSDGSGATTGGGGTTGGGTSGGGTSGGTTGGGSTGGGSTGGGGTNSTPAGAITSPGGITSIPASSVVAGQARLVIASVKFTPSTVRSQKQAIRAEITVKDTRGFFVRDAIVLIRGVPERRLLPVAEARTNEVGVVQFKLTPTKLLPLRAGGRLTMFTRARKDGEPVNGGVSARRLVSLRLARPR